VKDTENLTDIVGTGGTRTHVQYLDGGDFVCAAAGARMPRHGNRSVSSKSGSADVLEAMGANLGLNPKQIASCISELGVGFMFAPNPPRRDEACSPRARELASRPFQYPAGPSPILPARSRS